jgi:hypothetical protein
MKIGYVYKLACRDVMASEIYVGSTKNMNERRRAHRNNSNNENDKNYQLPVYTYIRAHGGFQNFEMIFIERVEYNNKFQLHSRERYYIEQLQATLNKHIPTRTPAEYYERYKESISDKHKEYRQQNKELISNKNKEYYEQNKEHYSDKHKEYYEQNKERLSEKAKQKYICVCGSNIRISDKAAHNKTKKHLLYLNQSEYN